MSKFWFVVRDSEGAETVAEADGANVSEASGTLRRKGLTVLRRSHPPTDEPETPNGLLRSDEREWMRRTARAADLAFVLMIVHIVGMVLFGVFWFLSSAMTSP